MICAGFFATLMKLRFKIIQINKVEYILMKFTSSAQFNEKGFTIHA